THIAPADDDGKLIGKPSSQRGVVSYPAKALGLCMGFTDAPWVATTEVYPDSPAVDGENCIAAQVASVTAALDYAATA
ncbi:MAG: peptidase, partial [Pseudomonadota bacterium]